MEIPNKISEIARIIREDWKKIYFGAVPYLKAMAELDDIDQNYYEDSGDMIVRYFLSNATTWRGETARAVKQKLNQLLSK